MSVATDIAALQTKHAAIAGVTTASTTYPSSIDAPLLPLVMTIPDSASHYWDAMGGDVLVSNRYYRVNVFVSIVNQGILTDTGLQAVITLLESFKNKYLTDPYIGHTSMISVDEGDLTDTGHMILDYGDFQYHGFVYRVRVIEQSSGLE